MKLVPRRLAPAILVLGLTFFAAAGWALTSTELIKKGVAELKDGKPQVALETFTTALKLDPNSAKPHYYIASALERMNAPDSARVEYETAIRIDPKYVEALTGLGNLLRKQGKDAEGTEKLELAVKYDPKDPAALYSLGTAYLKEKKFDEAEKIFRKGTLLKTGRAQFLAGTALALEGKGQLKEAEEIFIRARETDPNNLRVRLELGGFYERKKIPFLAVPEYKKAKELDPTNPEYHYLYGRASVGMNEFNEGLRAFVEATNVDSTYAPAYLEAGRLFYRAKRYDEAGEKFTKYTQLKEDDPQGWLELGRALSFSRDPALKATAVGALETARKSNPDQKEILGALCKLYGEQGEADSARVVCDRYASVADTLTAEELLRIGTIYVTLGDTTKAVPLLTKAIQQDSTLARDANFQLGTLYFKIQDYPRAAPYFERALAADSAFVPALLNIGLAEMQMKNNSRAIEHLRRAVALRPNDKATAPRSLVWIGQALMQMPSDSLPSALQSFQEAAAMDSTNGDAVRGAGLALLLLDNCNDALQWLARGTALEPEHVQGHIWLAQGYLKCKDVPRGKIEFNRVIEIDPTNKQASDGLALIRKFEDAQQKRAAQQSGSKR
ncbi:MAG TPA: tetratricopeptide repeat protein [Candidatus Limnocylindrales bacterium]|nr:tetratricopeptide repeat protein [Candidatus Limnocylindrales bacterium]